MGKPKKEPPSVQLSPEGIAAEALALVDERGAEAFTMRSVAERLKVTPMALYHHVPDKAALAALMVDAAIEEPPLPSLTGHWNEDLWLMARWTRENTRAHPALAELRRMFRVWTPAMLALTERWLGLWQQSGLGEGAVLLAAQMSSLAVRGLVNEEAILEQVDLPGDEVLGLLPKADQVFNARSDPDDAFELAVRSLIDGLCSRLSNGVPEKAP